MMQRMKNMMRVEKLLQLRTAINVHNVQHHGVNEIRYEELIDENINEKLREDLKQ